MIAKLLADCDHVLMDFDGPVCAVFGTVGNRDVARDLLTVLEGSVPTELGQTDDPFDVLRYASRVSLDVAQRVEKRLRSWEIDAVRTAPATPAAADALRALNHAGHTVTVVSNNSAAAVREYLKRNRLEGAVNRVSARASADAALLKPDPYLLLEAISAEGSEANRCLMVGDSVSDIRAAHAAGTAVIAYANKPGKRQRFEAVHPSGIIDDMAELVEAIAAP